MDLDKVFHKFPASYTTADIDLIKSAYLLAESAHGEQTRASGAPYITHCVGVANILLDIEVAPSLVVAGLLHDVVLDTPVTLEQIRSTFGESIANFVEDLTRITSLPQVTRADQHPEEITSLQTTEPLSDSRKNEYVMETLRKMLLAIGSDFRVIVVKLADRLHNMRTLKDMPPDKQKRIAEDTLEIYAPLANRLGIWQIKWELEDLAFRYVNPDEYNKIAEKLATQRQKRQDEINAIIKGLTALLEKSEIKAII